MKARQRASPANPPTPESFEGLQENIDFVRGSGDGRITKLSICGKLCAEHKLNSQQLRASEQYADAYHYGVMNGLQSPDLERPHADSSINHDLLAPTESAAEYRAEYREAGKCVGGDGKRLLDGICCGGMGIREWIQFRGSDWRNPRQAYTEVVTQLRIHLNQLCLLWGI